MRMRDMLADQTARLESGTRAPGNGSDFDFQTAMRDALAGQTAALARQEAAQPVLNQLNPSGNLNLEDALANLPDVVPDPDFSNPDEWRLLAGAAGPQAVDQSAYPPLIQQWLASRNASLAGY